jgi:leader peptidase (prepilin peptidase)/N-methyltransferase
LAITAPAGQLGALQAMDSVEASLDHPIFQESVRRIRGWLGPTGLGVAVALAVITGAIFGAGGRISGLLGRHQPFPFGPFLIAGTLTVWISGPGIWLGLYRWASGS